LSSEPFYSKPEQQHSAAASIFFKAAYYGVRNAAYEAGTKVTQKVTQAPVKSYADYAPGIGLGNKQVPITQFRTDLFSDAVRENTKGLKQNLASGRILNEGMTPGKYFKDAVVKGNVDPIKDSVTGKEGANHGVAAIRGLLLGFVGFDIFRNTKKTHDIMASREDGSPESQQQTRDETGKAFLKYLARGAITWELGTIGAAVGAALLPVALGPLSLGAIAGGALFAVAGQKLIDKLFKTGSHDQIHQLEDPNNPQKTMELPTEKGQKMVTDFLGVGHTKPSPEEPVKPPEEVDSVAGQEGGGSFPPQLPTQPTV
jgi:hypothetical protein